MIKRVGLYSLPKGTDPDEFWKFHTEVHSADFKKAVGSRVKKYVINRVKKIVRGEPKYWGLVEIWFESEKAMDEAFEIISSTKLLNGKTILEDFGSRVIDRFTVVAEEKEIEL